MVRMYVDSPPLACRRRLELPSFFISLAFLLLVALLPLGAMGGVEAQAPGAQGASAQPTSSQSADSGAAPAAASADLPLTRVVLFTAGLGYFEHDGRITGSRTVDLEFPAKGINDLLASLIVRDSGGGRVTSVDYASRDPLARTLGSFAIDLTDNPALAAILRQARGEKIQVAAPESITGTIVSVETRPVVTLSSRGSPQGAIGNQEAVFINLLTASGIRSINLENTSNEDWRNIRLDLVSGQPISFVMDLDRRVYTKRPEVSVPLPPTIMPQVYGEAMGPGEPGAEKIMRESLAASRASAAPSAAAPLSKGRQQAGDEDGVSAAGAIDLSQGVSAGAVGASLGELFRYSMVDPVTIARNQSAMLPIVNQAIQGERLSIYDERVLAKHPLAGFRIQNTTGLHLMGGPVSVFEGGAYAGEAEVDDIGSGGERIISYSVDLDVELSAHGKSIPDSITEVKISRGTLVVSRTLHRERDYTIVNRAARPKWLLVEYPLSSDWTLVEPAQPAEQTRDLYRFTVQLPGRLAAGGAGGGSSPVTAAGGAKAVAGPSAATGGSATGAGSAAPSTLRIVEERRISQTVALTNLDSDTVAFYLRQQVLSAAVRNALAKLTRLRGELADLVRERHGVESQIAGIHSDQERIRGNMSALDRSSTLYKRYVATLNSQEDTLESLVGRLDSLQMGERATQKEIDDYIGSLDLT